MKVTRRSWIVKSVSLAVVSPSILNAQRRTGYSLTGFEKRLRSGKGIEGLSKEDLPTPSLLVDLDKLEGNLHKMSQHAKSASIQLRPHAKTHKCPEIAKRQIAAGALGVCTSTIHEAEVMAAAGIQGLLITSELVGKNKIERLLRLARKQPETLAVVDHASHAEQLSDAAAAAKLTLNVMIDIDPIGRRTGILPGDDAFGLAERIMKMPHLKLRGIHSYSGASSHVTGFEARKEHSHKVMQTPLESFFRMKKAGMPVEIMSGGSTGTYNIDPSINKGMTELQVGSYVFMDVDYRRVGGQSGSVYEDFTPSLSVLATVISKNHPDRATVDAGYKAFATDRKFGPEIQGVTGVEYQFNGDEHGALIFNNPSQEIRLGDRLEFIVPHCDPNVNLYDRLFCVRGQKVVAVWPVAGRGYS